MLSLSSVRHGMMGKTLPVTSKLHKNRLADVICSHPLNAVQTVLLVIQLCLCQVWQAGVYCLRSRLEVLKSSVSLSLSVTACQSLPMAACLSQLSANKRRFKLLCAASLSLQRYLSVRAQPALVELLFSACPCVY